MSFKIYYSSEQISNMNAQYKVHTFSHTLHFKGLGSLGEKKVFYAEKKYFTLTKDAFFYLLIKKLNSNISRI